MGGGETHLYFVTLQKISSNVFLKQALRGFVLFLKSQCKTKCLNLGLKGNYH